MVSGESAQLYTIEGVSSGILILITSYFVMSGTSLYTPLDTHISEMQLEQMANDILMVLDTPWQYSINTVPPDQDRFLASISPLEEALSDPAYQFTYNETKISIFATIDSFISNYAVESADAPIPLHYSLKTTRPGQPTITIHGTNPSMGVTTVRAAKIVQTNNDIFFVELIVWRE